MYLGFDIKYRSSKIHVFLLFIKPVFPMFDKSQDCSSKCGCILRTVRGTWNFVRQQATPAQGRAGEAHMNMDVNLRRLADKIILILKFLVLLTIFMQHPHSTDGADILVKATERQFTIKQNIHLRTAGIPVQITPNPLS